jgi:hypothetical protein
MTLADLKRLALAVAEDRRQVRSGEKPWTKWTLATEWLTATEPERVLAMLAVIEAAKAMSIAADNMNIDDSYTFTILHHAKVAFDAEFAKLEPANPTR